MAEILVEKISVEDIDTVCCSLGKLVELMNPHSQAMVIGSSGELSFTRRGMKILSESCPGHPLAKLIIQAVNKYHMDNGDDCQIFIFLLHEIVSGIKDKFANKSEVYIRKEISSNLLYFQQILPEIFEKIRSCSHTVYAPTDSELFLKHLEGLVLTTLTSKFSSRIAEKLTELICKFLCATISDWSTATDTLFYITSHFDIFCSKVTSDLNDSLILKGFVFNQKFNVKVNSLTDVHFVVTHEVSQQFSDIYSVEKNENMKRLLEWASVENAICNLLERGIRMILTPSVACENIKSFCQLKGMVIVDRIIKDDIDLILSVCDISYLNNLSDKCDFKNIGFCNHVKPLTFAKCDYVHLEISPVRSNFIPHHFLLCIPVDALGKECYAEILNCLKIVTQWLSFEVAKESSGLNASQVVGISFPLGLWELILKDSLSSISSLQILCQVLDLALVKVICKNWNIKMVDFSGMESYRVFHERIKQHVPIPIEAISIKEDLIYNVLSLIRQLLKIDAVVCNK